MPNETQQAIDWALTQEYEGEPVTKETPQELVDKVRKYFNDHEVEYHSFSFTDLVPFLPVEEEEPEQEEE